MFAACCVVSIYRSRTCAQRLIDETACNA